jgi:Protein of unknown function (DUF1573)
MKKILLFAFLFVAATASAQTVATSQKPAQETISLKQANHDFGKIQQGRPVTHVFEVTNIGTVPLRIENVQASCGCTTPEWSYEPVKAGASTPIKVGYNAATEGQFQKTVTITYNGGQTKVLQISGIVYKTAATSAPVNSSIALLKQNNQ